MENITKTEIKEQLEIGIEEYLKKTAYFFCNKEEIEKIASETGFVKNCSKITGHLFLSVFVFAMSIHENPTLAQLSGILESYLKNFEITREAIHQRINEEAVVFFEKMLGLAIKLTVPNCFDIKVFEAFNRVLVLDSTAFQLPEELSELFPGKGGSASEAGAKIQFCYDLKSSYWFYFLEPGTSSDRSCENHFVDQLQKGDLLLKDLGYFNVEAFESIDKAQAYYLSRLHSDASVYQKDANGNLVPFDLLDYLHRFINYRIEIPVFLKNRNGIYSKTRLVIEAAPEQVVNKRLRKLNKECKSRGKQPSQRQCLFATVNIYVCNAPKEMLLDSCFRLLYTLRWQIELIFKSWKSNFSVHKMRGKRVERFKCTLYAKLIFIVLSSRITALAKGYLWFSKNKEVSDYKSAKHFKVIVSSWLSYVFKQQISEIFSLLSDAFGFICKHCYKIKQKSRTYPLQLLEIFTLMSKT